MSLLRLQEAFKRPSPSSKVKSRDVFRDEMEFTNRIRQQNSPAASGEEQFHNSPEGQWDKIQPNPNKKYVCKAVFKGASQKVSENFTVFRKFQKMGGTSVGDAEEWRERSGTSGISRNWNCPSRACKMPTLASRFFCCFFSTKVYKTSLSERCVV